MSIPKIYVASKHTHCAMWRYHRTRGHNIISSWIDLDTIIPIEEIGHTYWPLWLQEAASADYLIFYAEPADRHAHNSNLLEIGACLVGGGTVLHVGVSETMKTANGDLADFTYHDRWKRLVDLEAAFTIAKSLASPDLQAPV